MAGLRKRLTRGERANEREPDLSQRDNVNARASECRIEATSERVCGVCAGVGRWGAWGEQLIANRSKAIEIARASERRIEATSERACGV